MTPGCRQHQVSSLLERLQATVGQELVFQAPEEIGRAAIRQYVLAVGDFNPLYTDRQLAAEYGLRDVVAPPTLLCDTWQYVDSDMNERGDLTGRGFFGQLSGLRAGNEYEFFQPVHPDDVLIVRWLVKDVYQRSGRSGSLIFQVVEATYTNQHGDMLARNTETLFYRNESPE